jgi:FtsH-binding integral membrane protein
MTKIGGEYKGLAYPFFMLGTAIIDGIFGLAIAIFLTTIAQNLSGKVGLVLVSCLAGLIRVMISVIMIYNRTIDGGRDFSGLPPWWYTDQLKILIVDFFGGFLIAFFALMLIRYLRNGRSGSIS